MATVIEQTNEKTNNDVQEYYGKVLGSQQDLKTSACCSMESVPMHHREILGQIEDEILARFYGCGSPIPEALEGTTVLDLGCGTGRDVYLLSKLVGPSGRVIGVDMTAEQLAVARKYESQQMATFGFEKSNVDFREGYIEDLAGAGIADASVDVVVSNCVLNLSPDKPKVFREIFRVLKPGGELYFSDVFADRRLDPRLMNDPVLLGECLSGAMYLEDFRRLLQGLGCKDHRVVGRSPIAIEDAEVDAKIGMAKFESVTVRAFKLDSMEDCCEDYGQVATYKGTVNHAPHRFALDDHHVLETGRPMLVCGNTAAMLSETRYAPHFEVTGDRSRHFGVFGCGEGDGNVGDDDGGCC